VYIAYGCWLQAAAPISLDDEVMLGPYCVLASANHTRLGQSFRYGPLKMAPIHVKKGAWLGAHVVVLKGASIGAGAVIAAHTTVQETVPDGVAYGVPNQATVLKSDRT
jgi:acetyltransferase-like isoleucine patch superfamily enzyme